MPDKPTPAPATIGVPVEYKVVDSEWSPSDPTQTEAMLNELGQDGWQLSAVYPDPTRERTRWVFSR